MSSKPLSQPVQSDAADASMGSSEVASKADDSTVMQVLDAEEKRLRGLIGRMETGGVIGHSGTDEHLVPLEDRTQDGGAELAERTLQLGLLESVEAQIAEVGAARDRVRMSTYGLCEHCGQAIAAERLDAQPLARSCTAHTL
jgi:DnaK suppressor protein